MGYPVRLLIYLKTSDGLSKTIVCEGKTILEPAVGGRLDLSYQTHEGKKVLPLAYSEVVEFLTEKVIQCRLYDIRKAYELEPERIPNIKEAFRDAGFAIIEELSCTRPQ